MFFIPVERFRQKLNIAMVPRLLASDSHTAPQFDPGDC